MTTWTEDNVTDLVSAVNELLENIDIFGEAHIKPTDNPYAIHSQLVKVMEPFRPAPDEVLRLEVARIWRIGNGHEDGSRAIMEAFKASPFWKEVE